MKIIELVLRFADKGVPLNRQHFREAFCIFLSAQPDERLREIRFKYGIPGIRYDRGFLARHRQASKYVALDMQQHCVLISHNFMICNESTSSHSTEYGT